MATLFAVVVGMTLGILAAVNQNGIVDYISVTIAILFYSMPNFVMGFLLILLLRRLAAGSRGRSRASTSAAGTRPQDWILPTIALGAAPLATWPATRARA